MIYKVIEAVGLTLGKRVRRALRAKRMKEQIDERSEGSGLRI